MKFFSKYVTQLGDEVVTSAAKVVTEVNQVMSKTESVIDTTVAPMRKNIIKRFPIIFLLAVTFGVSLTFFGIEQFLSRSTFFSGHPLVSFVTGVSILVLTGTLYKKLG